jgi:hypothetical protein
MRKFFPYLFVIALFAGFLACERYELYKNPDVKIRFSTDTVFFDTIFTTFGSTTKQVRVHNPYNQPVEISYIRLAGGDNSVFRLNIDGYQRNEVINIEIPPKDSIYIFVEVTINPNNVDSILLIQDSIVFNTNGNIQDVDLMAWGQDVHLIDGEEIATQTWINDKSYLVINSMMVDTNEILTIEEGVRLHFHRNSWLFVAGTIIVNGTLENPVVFQGDRLEQLYKDVAGQWNGIWLLPGSRDNKFNYAVLKNAVHGIVSDTLASLLNPTLRLSNTIIKNMSSTGIWGRGTTIQASNCEISECGELAVFLWIGGRYEFYHCTIANYWGGDWKETTIRSTPAVFLKNYYEDINGNIQVRPIEQATFGNCIIYGGRESEFEIDRYPDTELNYTLSHTISKIDNEEFDLDDKDHFVNYYNFEDPKFISVRENNYELDTLSPAKDKGSLSFALPFPTDLHGENRLSDDGPDIGAYERIEVDTLGN